jgi:hypothetical protein
MDIVYSLGGVPFQFEDGSLWAKDGSYVGKLIDGVIYSPAGEYLGEPRQDRLVSYRHHEYKRKTRHQPERDRQRITAVNKRRITRQGMQDFRA